MAPCQLSRRLVLSSLLRLRACTPPLPAGYHNGVYVDTTNATGAPSLACGLAIQGTGACDCCAYRARQCRLPPEDCLGGDGATRRITSFNVAFAAWRCRHCYSADWPAEFNACSSIHAALDSRHAPVPPCCADVDHDVEIVGWGEEDSGLK